MLDEALRTPTRTPDAAVTIFLGGVLWVVSGVLLTAWVIAVVASPLGLVAAPLALLPALVLAGYRVRVIEAGLRGEDAAPSFVRWGGLVADGVRSALLTAAYLLPAALFAVGGAAVAVALGEGLLPTGVVSERVAVFAVLAGGVLAALAGVTALYLRPAGLAALAATGSVRGGLSPRRVRRVAASGEYAVAWLLAAVVLAVGYVAGGVLSVVLVGPFVAFFAQVAAYSLYGRGAADALASDVAERASADDVRAVASEEAGPGADERVPAAAPEAPAAVQVGRSVEGIGGIERVEPTPSPESDADPTAAPGDDGSGFRWGEVPEPALRPTVDESAVSGADDE